MAATVVPAATFKTAEPVAPLSDPRAACWEIPTASTIAASADGERFLVNNAARVVRTARHSRRARLARVAAIAAELTY